MRLEIDALGTKVMDRQLIRLQHNLEVPAIALQEIAVRLREIIEEQFDSQGGRSGGWAPLAASTVREKAHLGQDPRILFATHRLVESLTRKFDTDHIEELSRNTLRFGSSVTYGIYHQTGTRKMPKRPPVVLKETDRRELVKIVQRSILAGVHA